MSVQSIGLMGAAGSGKDTTARILIRMLQDAGFETFDTYSFAGPLKEFCVDTFGLAPHIVEPTTPQARQLRETIAQYTFSKDDLSHDFGWALSEILEVYAREKQLTYGEMLSHLGYMDLEHAVTVLFERYMSILKAEEYTPGLFKSILYKVFTSSGVIRYNTSPRRLLQITGTEFFRDNVSQSFWTDIAPKRNVIYTDVRFANELDFVHGNGGLVLKIVNKNQKVITSSSHASEQLVYTATPDYVIEHDGVNLSSIENAVERFIATLQHN